MNVETIVVGVFAVIGVISMMWAVWKMWSMWAYEMLEREHDLNERKAALFIRQQAYDKRLKEFEEKAK